MVDLLSRALVGLSISHAGMAVKLVEPDTRLPALTLAAISLAASVWLLLLATGQQRVAGLSRRRDASSQCSDVDLEPASPPHPSVLALRDMLLDKGYTPPSDDELLRHLEAARPTGSSAQLNVAAGYRRIVATEQWRSQRMVSSEKPPASDTDHPAVQPRTEVRGFDRLSRPCLRIRVCEPLSTFPNELLATLDAHFFGGAPPAHPQLCVIVDLSMLKAQRPPLAAGFDLVRQLRAHYPQRAASVHIVLLPPFARWVVSAVCSLLDSRTAKKIIVHDPPVDGTVLSLAAHFSPSELPRAYGGREEAAEGDLGLLGGPDGAPLTPNPSDVKLPMSRTASQKDALSSLQVDKHPQNESGEEMAEDEEEAAKGRRGRGTAASAPVPDARLVWTRMSVDEHAAVDELRAVIAADPELADMPTSIYGDDELLRYLADVPKRLDVAQAVEVLRTSWLARQKVDFASISAEEIDEWRQHVRVDGLARSGERAVVLVMSRALQDVLLSDPEPFIRAVLGVMELVKCELFVEGKVESVQTIVQVERGFRLSLQSVPIAATQRMMSLVSDIYPSYTSHILIVNLPGYLAWFVRFVKGMLCEASANKIEIVTEYTRLLDFFDEPQLPEYYLTRKSIAP